MSKTLTLASARISEKQRIQHQNMHMKFSVTNVNVQRHTISCTHVEVGPHQDLEVWVIDTQVVVQC